MKKKKATPKKAAKRKPVAPSPKKKNRQPRLPGMEDPKLESLHAAALDYAEIRDQRQALTASEVELKEKLIDLMHINNRETYTCQGVTVTLVHEEETVKVKIKKVELDAAEEEEEGPGIPADTVEV